MTRPSAATFKRHFAGAASALAIALIAVPGAAAEEEPHSFDIPAQSLSDALVEFARQSHINVVAPKSVTEGRLSTPVVGDMEPSEALTRMMQNTGVEFRAEKDGSYVLVQAVASAPKQKAVQLAQNAPVPGERNDDDDEEVERAPKRAKQAGAEDRERTLDRVTVTGSLIRGFAPESSPLQVYDRETILDSGATTTEQFIRSLPQNFGGGSTDLVPSGVPGDADVRYNDAMGTGANLRGLGSGATLTLLNGRRLAPSSQIGNFVDLSMIPVSALERVDVLSDGASSIYGGDAVAGVINFVLRDDFDGAETSVRLGSVTDGDMKEFRISQALGKSWSTGNLLAVYEYHDRDRLTLADRPDIPPPATVSENAEHFFLLPRQQRNSAILSVTQSAGADLQLSATGLFSERKGKNSYPTSSGQVTGSTAESQLTSVSFGAAYQVTTSWTADFDATYSATSIDEELNRFIPNSGPIDGLDMDSDLWSVDLRFSGELAELPGGAVQTAFGGQYREETLDTYATITENRLFKGDRQVSALYAEVFVPLVGESNSISGVRRLNATASVRYDDYSDFGSTTNPKVGVLWSPIDGLNVRGSYSEAFAPPPLGRVGDLFSSAQIAPISFVQNLVRRESLGPDFEGKNYLITNGTLADLDPETSRTITYGVDYSWSFDQSEINIRTSYYDIDFEGRLGTTPRPGNASTLLAPWIDVDDPDALPDGTVIFLPSDDYIASILAGLRRPPTYVGGATSAAEIGLINNAGVVRNLASVTTKGIDLNIDYARKSGSVDYVAGLNLNNILEFERRAAVTTPAVDVLNTYLNPVDLRLRGHVGVKAGSIDAKLFVNYTDSYRTDSTNQGEEIESWTTLDFRLGYEFAPTGAGVFNNARVSISALNLLDEDPPVAPSNGGFSLAGYDQANASPLGRFIALELSKRF